MKPQVFPNVLILTLLTASAFAKFEIGVNVLQRPIEIGYDGLPQAVKSEAASPLITNPYSNRTFGVETIGTFDPTDDFDFSQTSPYIGFDFAAFSWLEPYAKVSAIFLSGDNSTNSGSYGEGYTFATLIATSGVDYIRYWYGMQIDDEVSFEPEIGLRVKLGPVRLGGGIGYQPLNVTFYKGVEAWGRTDTTHVIAKKRYDLLNYHASITVVLSEAVVLGCEGIWTDCDGVESHGLGVNAAIRF